MEEDEEKKRVVERWWGDGELPRQSRTDMVIESERRRGEGMMKALYRYHYKHRLHITQHLERKSEAAARKTTMICAH